MKFKNVTLRRKVEFWATSSKMDNTSFNCKTIYSRQEVFGTKTVMLSRAFRTHRLLSQNLFQRYSQIAKPLSDLTRKDMPFMFEQPQMEELEKFKKLLTESPVLSIFQQGRTTELHTDASQQG
ncbi:transposon Tf2-6 polyprotein [Trichonephila clavipes]|nr:transposon Tf2-6 polyprotein [Trichonephila clavipes]